MKFAEVTDITIPQGEVIKIEETSGLKRVLWEKKRVFASVYAIGSNASQWSGGASPDSQGFYPINIPSAYKLLEHVSGFGAKVNGGGYYFCGVKSFKNSKSGAASTMIETVSTPEKMTVGSENVNQVLYVPLSHYTWTATSTNPLKKNEQTYNGYLLLICYGGNKIKALGSNVRLFYNYEASGTSNTSWYSSHSESITISNASELVFYKFPQQHVPTVNLNSGVYFLADDGASVWNVYSESNHKWAFVKKNASSVGLDYKAVKLFQPYNLVSNGSTLGNAASKNPLFRYLSESKLLDNDASNFSMGTIKDAWVYKTTAYVQTSNNRLYEKKGTASWELLGDFDIKKLLMISESNMLLLTQEGKLYHKGTSITGITDAHTEITQIYPSVSIYDFTYGGSTLTVMKE